MEHLIAHLSPTLAVGMPMGGTWIVIAIVVLLLFGGKKLPELGKGLGGAIKSFKQGMHEAHQETAQVDPQQTSADQQAVLPANPQPKFDPITGKPLAPPVSVAAKFDPYTGKPLETTTIAAAQPLLETRS